MQHPVYVTDRDLNQCANGLILAADGNLSREMAERFARHAARSFDLTIRRETTHLQGRFTLIHSAVVHP